MLSLFCVASNNKGGPGLRFRYIIQHVLAYSKSSIYFYDNHFDTGFTCKAGKQTNMYNAFISYSHAADGKLAPALQEALQKFAKPWYKLRNLNIFRDEASLTASPNLWYNIQLALDKSEYMIYLASPASAASKWTNKEVEYWVQHKSVDKLLVALTDGEITWDDKNNLFLNPELNSLPEILDKKFTEEPFYVDLRNSKTHKDLSLNNPIFKKEVLKLAAQLHGKEPKDLAGEEVAQHNKMIRVRNMAIGTLLFLLIAAVGAAWFANTKRIEANQKTIEARENKNRADSNATYANRQAIIAREQRDSAAIARQEAENSAIFARLQKDTAQIERDNAVMQTNIAITQKEIAEANYLLSEAKSASVYDPTLGINLVNAAMLKHNSTYVEAGLYGIYRENSFYKIIARHRRSIRSVALSTDGKYILTASADSTAALWELNGKLVHTFKDPSQLICATISPDGKYVLTGSREGVVRLWNLDEKIAREFKVDSYVESVAFSPDGKSILAGYYDSTARLWDINGKLIQQFKGHHGQVTSVSFAPDGQSILTASYDGTARLWERNGKLIWVFKNNAIIYTAAFSPDGKFILTGSLDKIARLWSLDGTLVQEFKGHTDAVISVEFSPDGNFILTGSWDKTAALWDRNGNLMELFKGNPTSVNAAFSKDGKSIVTAGGEPNSMYATAGDHTIRLWEIKKSFREIRNNAPVIAVAFAPDSKFILTGSSDKIARLWNVNEALIRELKGHSKDIICVAFSRDGKFILSGSTDSTVILWGVNGNLILKLRSHTGYINAVSFSPDGKYMLTASEDKTARLWDINGKLLQVLPHETAVRCAIFSPDGQFILTATSRWGEVARLWSLNGKLVKEYFDITYSGINVTDLAFSPDGKSFAAATAEYRIRLWGLKGNLIKAFVPQEQAITAIKFSPDGKAILSGSTDAVARLFSLKGNYIQEFRGHTDQIFSVDFSTDGKFVLTGSIDNTARIWHTSEPFEKFMKSKKIELLSAEQRKQYGLQ
jgi:WD40 repeat protein